MHVFSRVFSRIGSLATNATPETKPASAAQVNTSIAEKPRTLVNRLILLEPLMPVNPLIIGKSHLQDGVADLGAGRSRTPYILEPGSRMSA
jgi:hypothetical protein